MSISDVVAAFNNAADGVRCVRALMTYCDEESRQGGGKRDHQLLTLQLSDGSVHEILVKPGEGINIATTRYAQKIAAEAEKAKS
jgi:hypothetical protein